VTRRSARILVSGVAVLVVGVVGAVLAWNHMASVDRETVAVLLVLRQDGSGQLTISTARGRSSDPGPFAEQVRALTLPAARSRGVRAVYTDLARRFDMVDVTLEEIPAPLRLNTAELQRATAAAGFRRLKVGLYSEEHWQVEPDSSARAGRCFGNALSCEWRLRTTSTPLDIEIHPA
jgi:hypothetical protein